MSSIRGTRQHKKETCPATVKPMKDMTKKHKKNKQMKQATAVEPTKGVAKKKQEIQACGANSYSEANERFGEEF